MLSVKTILSKYSNAAIADRSGYPNDIIHMLRKGQVDEFTIKQLPGGRAIPTRQVLEGKILEKFNNVKVI